MAASPHWLTVMKYRESSLVIGREILVLTGRVFSVLIRIFYYYLWVGYSLYYIKMCDDFNTNIVGSHRMWGLKNKCITNNYPTPPQKVIDDYVD